MLTQESSASGSERQYRPDIDGIRSIAILSVVLYHAGTPWITGGFTGVDIFFVISGYLIGGHIFTELRAGTFSFLSFYRRRAKRILPAFYAVMFFTMVASLLLLSPGEASQFGRYAFSAALSGSNVFFWAYSNYFQPESSFHPLLMTWSLGVEEQFYAVVPVLMMLLVRLRQKLLLPAIFVVCVLSVVLASFEIHTYPKNAFYLLHERAWELGAGVALAVWELLRKRASLSKSLTHAISLTALALILAPMFVLNAHSLFPGPAALPSVLGTALIIATPGAWVNRRLLSLRPLVFIGRISYSWYLWHWPLLAYLRIAGGSNTLPPVVATAVVAASLLAAVLSYYFVEQPFRHSSSPAHPLLVRYAVISLVLLIPCTFLWLSDGIPQRFPKLAEIDRTARLPDPCLARHSKIDLSPPCYDAEDLLPSVALWGDSHASALEPAVSSIAGAQGYDLVRFSHAACLPLTGVANYRRIVPLNARQCLQFNRQILSLLQHDPHIRIVMLAGRWTDSFSEEAMDEGYLVGSAAERVPFTQDKANALFKQSLTATILALQGAGKQVIVMEDWPSFNFDPLVRFSSTQIPARRFLAMLIGHASVLGAVAVPAADITPAAIANAQLKATLAGVHDAPLIPLRSKFCGNGNECIYRDRDRLLYSDSQHLTPDGATYALRDFRLPPLNLAGDE